MSRIALCLFSLALLATPSHAKDAVDFSGTYSARIKYNDGSVGTRVIHISQTADTIRIEIVGSKAQPTWYKLGEAISVADARGKEHRERASISGRSLRLEVEHHSPPEAISGTEETVYALSKDGKRLTCTHDFVGPNNLGQALTDVYTRVEESSPAPPAK